MSKINDGGPAFPVSKDVVYPQLNGMTLRDWFAGQIAAAMVRRAVINEDWVRLPIVSYEMADAMLSVRGDAP